MDQIQPNKSHIQVNKTLFWLLIIVVVCAAISILSLYKFILVNAQCLDNPLVYWSQKFKKTTHEDPSCSSNLGPAYNFKTISFNTSGMDSCLEPKTKFNGK